jgi:hypothetical protein
VTLRTDVLGTSELRIGKRIDTTLETIAERKKGLAEFDAAARGRSLAGNFAPVSPPIPHKPARRLIGSAQLSISGQRALPMTGLGGERTLPKYYFGLSCGCGVTSIGVQKASTGAACLTDSVGAFSASGSKNPSHGPALFARIVRLPEACS